MGTIVSVSGDELSLACTSTPMRSTRSASCGGLPRGSPSVADFYIDLGGGVTDGERRAESESAAADAVRA